MNNVLTSDKTIMISIGEICIRKLAAFCYTHDKFLLEPLAKK